MNLHHSVDPRLWNLASEIRIFALDGPPITRRSAIRTGLLGGAVYAVEVLLRRPPAQAFSGPRREEPGGTRAARECRS